MNTLIRFPQNCERRLTQNLGSSETQALWSFVEPLAAKRLSPRTSTRDTERAFEIFTVGSGGPVETFVFQTFSLLSTLNLHKA